MSPVKKLAQYELEDGNRVQKALSIIVRDQSTGNRNNNLAIIENSGIFLETLKNYSIKHDLARSCFQLWPKIGDEGDKISGGGPEFGTRGEGIIRYSNNILILFE